MPLPPLGNQNPGIWHGPYSGGTQALGGVDLPPSGYPNFNYGGGQTYGQGGNVSINPPSLGQGSNPASQYYGPTVQGDLNAVPGAGAAGPNSGWTGRLPRYLMGGYVGLGIGAINEAIRAIRGNRGNPASNMVGSHGRGQGSYGPPNSTPPSDTPPGLGGGGLGQPIGTRYGLPDYGSNPSNYPSDWSYGGPQSGPGAPHRGDIVGARGNEPVYQGGRVSTDTRLSGSIYDAASRAQNAQEMGFQASGGYNTGVNTGTTQDTGHSIFGAQSHTHGLMSDGVLEIQPGGIYDTVFSHGMGANNPNAYHDASRSAQAPAQTALIEQQIRSQQPSLQNPQAPQVAQGGIGRAAEFYRNLMARRAQGSGTPVMGPLQIGG